MPERFFDRLEAQPRRVAIVRASRIGDFLCATPALRAFRRVLPEAEFTFIGLPFVRDLVERSRSLDRFEPFPGFPGMAEQFFDAQKANTFFARMQAERFDLAIQLHGSGVYSNPFTLMLGARQTVGFVRPGEPPGRLDAAVAMPPDTLPEVRRLLVLPLHLGAPIDNEATEFPLVARDVATAERLLAGVVSPLIGLHPMARERTKRWPLERFAEAARVLRTRYGGTIVIVGGSDQGAETSKVESLIGGGCVNLVGATDLGALGAVIARLDVLITNDSGPAHIAYALGTPTVTIFGATDPVRWIPPTARGIRVLVHPVTCRPCDYADCPIGYTCLEGVNAGAVVGAAEDLLARAAGPVIEQVDETGSWKTGSCR